MPANPAAAADFIPVLATSAVGAAMFFAAGAYGLFNPASRLWGPVVSRGPREGDGRVALTFDDGPWPGTTDVILDALAALNVRAAFFVIGVHVQRWPDLVRRMHDEGHVVGNHTFDHSHTGLFGRDRYWRHEIRRADDAIEKVIGRRPALFRPPMGYKHWHVMNMAADTGHAVVTWSRRAWDLKTTKPTTILERLVEPSRGGDILLLHDGNDPRLKPFDRAGTREAVRPLVEGLRRRGLEPARLDELLAIPAYQDQRPTSHPSPISPLPPQ
jgi:peptidoglycan/xylan/chitin deacetylase (PgdA/CDA1 family)